MSILDVLPSLRAAAPVRFDPDLWPSTTECVHGKIRVCGVELDDILDTVGTAVVRFEAGLAVTVTRVREVSGNHIVVDGGPGRSSIAAAALGNRHPLGPTAQFEITSARDDVGSVVLPADVRAGDVLAMAVRGAVRDDPTVR